MRSGPVCAHRRPPLLVAASVVALSLTFTGILHASESIAVVVDQAKLVKLPDRVATIVVGNPLIADVALQPGGTMIVTGKGYGSTNVMALDRSGSVLIDRIVQVEGATEKLVTVYKGVERESYSCTPVCQRRTTLGDSQAYFSTSLGQSGTLSAQAAGAAAEPK